MERRRQGRLRYSDDNDGGGEFSGFSLCFIDFRLEAEEPHKLEMPMGAQRSALFSQRTKNGTE